MLFWLIVYKRAGYVKNVYWLCSIVVFVNKNLDKQAVW